MAKISVWIAKRKPNGTTKSGRTAWKTEAFRFKNEIAKDPDARVLVFWKVGRRNGEKLMEATGENGWRQAVRFRDAKLKELMADQEAIPEGKTSWKDFKSQFQSEKLQATGSQRLAGLTLRDYAQLLDRIEKFVSPKTIEDLDNATVSAFRSKLLTHKSKQSKDGQLSAGSVAKNLRYLKSLLNFARRKGYQVATLVESVKTWPNDTRFLPDEALQRIFEVAASAKRPILPNSAFECADWWKAFLWVMRANGLRLNEALSLRWEDISLDNRTMLIPFQKNGTATTLPLTDRTIDYLRKIVEFDEFVFPTGGLHEKALYEEFHRLQGLAGVTRRCLLASRDKNHRCTSTCQFFGFHSLRKAFCSVNALNGMPMQTLCALARHSSITVTAKYYVDQEAIRLSAADLLSDPDFKTEEPAK